MFSTCLSPSLQLNAPFSSFLSPNHTVLENGVFSSFPSPRPAVSRNGSLGFRKKWKHSMFSGVKTAKTVVRDGILRINGRDVLMGVPENVTVTPLVDNSAFLGTVSDKKRCRHVFKLGVLEGYRLLCLFRFKIWWMIPRIGNSGSDVPVETQMLLLEVKEDSSVDQRSHNSSSGSVSYTVFLPVLDGDFRSSLQGNPASELEFCIESGDSAVTASQFREAVFINFGDNPFHLMKESMKILEKHKGSFSHRADKRASWDLHGYVNEKLIYQQKKKKKREKLLASDFPHLVN